MTKKVNGATLARRAKYNATSQRMNDIVSAYDCKVYHTSQEVQPNEGEYAPHYMLEGNEHEVEVRTDKGQKVKVNNIDYCMQLIENLCGYAEGMRFPLEDGRTFIVLSKVIKVADEN